jgi:hypothetical protein
MTDVTWVPTLQFRYVVKPVDVLIESSALDREGRSSLIRKTYRLPMLEQLWAKRAFTESGWGETLSSEWRDVKVEGTP